MGSGAPGDLELAEVLEMLNGHLDRGDAAGVDGVGYLPVGSFGHPVVIGVVGESHVDGPGGDVQAGPQLRRTGPRGAGLREWVILPLLLLCRRWNWGKLR